MTSFATSTRRLATAVGIVLVLIVAVWYFGIFRTESHKLAAAHQAHAAAETQITTMQGQVTNLEGLLKQVPQDKAKLAAFQAAVPDTPQLDAALNDINQVAVRSGATITSLGPSKPSTTPGSSGQKSAVPAVPLSIQASGSYSQLMALLSGLDAMPRTIVVNTIAISGTGPKLSATISAEIFYA